MTENLKPVNLAALHAHLRNQLEGAAYNVPDITDYAAVAAWGSMLAGLAQALAWVTFGSEATSQDYGGPLRLHVPVLARLNQDDPRLLQDGSRVVDALAQVHVALYILHRTKEIT